jgi:hypothetical protein
MYAALIAAISSFFQELSGSPKRTEFPLSSSERKKCKNQACCRFLVKKVI